MTVAHWQVMRFIRTLFTVLCGALPLAACSLGEEPAAPPDTNNPECQIQSEQEKGPGYPFDLAMYETQVLPKVVQACSASGCHGGPTGQGNFTVWADSAPGNCNFARTFNQLKANIDLANPEASRVVFAVRDSLTHPLKLGAADPTTQLLLDYAKKAAETNGGVVAPPGASPFDYMVYQTVIQPIFDTAEGQGCASQACHGAAVAPGNFKLASMPAANSADMQANFTASTLRASLQAPENSVLLLKATTRHGAGLSTVVTPEQGQAILAWIQKAQQNQGGGGGVNCTPAANFNVQVFRDEIQPILFGQIGLNTGCAAGACHGADRSGGALVLKETNTPEQNLQNFACFVDLAQPINSEILACPLDQAPCRHRPHPGQDVFQGATDPNFQKVLSFLYGGKTGSTPLDFAFYARAINPIFNDPTAVQGGAQNRTCADTLACHGTSVAGQQAPNGSNFPLIANLTDQGSLAYNFSSASNFINFIQPEGSSLFLYPTNQIANLENPFATGLPHPGGEDFAVDSREAQLILRWARGLRPNAQGFITDWLVAGDFSATLITSPTAINESTVVPKIFDPSGGPFNEGKWDALISDEVVVDLNQEFPRVQTAGRVAYATVYVINTAGADINAEMLITSPNSIRVIVDGSPVAQSDDASNGLSALVKFPAFAGSKKVTRVVLKVLQTSDDAEFAFTVQLRDEFGNPLTDTSGELIIKLGPDGGI
jgi:hypothetical protein